MADRITELAPYSWVDDSYSMDTLDKEMIPLLSKTQWNSLRTR